MKNFLNKLIGDKSDFSLQHRILNAMSIVGIILAIVTGGLDYLTRGYKVIAIFSAISAIVFISLFIYSHKARKFTPLFNLLFGYMSLVYLPGLWLLNGGSMGGLSIFGSFYLHL